MYLKSHRGPRVVTLSEGHVLSLADLPRSDERYWTAARKARVVEAVIHGLLARDEARRRYGLSEAELAAWEAAYLKAGTEALKARATRRGRPRRTAPADGEDRPPRSPMPRART